MISKNTWMVGGLLALLLVLVLGTQALGFTGFKNTGAGGGPIQTGTNLPSAASGSPPQAAAPDASTSGAAAAPALGLAQGSGAAQSSIAYPFGGGGPFQPGFPPFGYNPGVSADGLIAWGVAFQKTSDASAKPGADLIKAAYQDARKQAETLASATGLTLGKVLAINDFTMNQPYFTGCIQPAQGAPGATGQAPAPANPALVVPPGKPLPVPGPCNASTDHYLVAWVMVRFAI